jgi:hypothetical protein
MTTPDFFCSRLLIYKKYTVKGSTVIDIIIFQVIENGVDFKSDEIDSNSIKNPIAMPIQRSETIFPFFGHGIISSMTVRVGDS